MDSTLSGKRFPLVRCQRPRLDHVYQTDAAACNACLLKATCIDSDHGRRVKRSFHEDYLERARGYYAVPAYERAMRKWKRPEGACGSRCSPRQGSGTACGRSGCAACGA